MKFDIAVIGAGASGMAVSILLAKKGYSVILLERQSRGGKKILVSGNGRCNIANIKISKSNFHINNQALIDSLLKSYTFEDIKKFFNSLGLELTVGSDGRVFPSSFEAKSVLNLLEAALKRLNVTVFYNIKNLKIYKNFNITANGKEFKANKIVVATGNKAATALGANESGLEIAKSFGHNIITPLPALVPLNSNDKICKIAQGLKLEAKVTLFYKKEELTSKIGDILFTKYGISGLSILDLSIEVAKSFMNNKKNLTLKIDFFYKLTKKELLALLKKRIDKKRNLELKLWLSGLINTKLASVVLKDLNLSEKNEQNLTVSILKEIVDKLKGYEIKIDSLRDFKYAEVALGGVDSKELNLNFESKKKSGLYFIGEVVDATGERGGYNFIFAWFSAMRVANSLP